MVRSTRRNFLMAIGGATLGAAALSGLTGLETFSHANELAVGKSLIPDGQQESSHIAEEIKPAVCNHGYRSNVFYTAASSCLAAKK